MNKITNTIVENINKIVNEELSINTGVEISAENIVKKIQDSIKVLGVKEGSFKENIEGFPFNVYWKTILCNTEDDADKENYANASFMERLSFLNVIVGITENGKVHTDTLSDSIFHELSHIFQQNMAGKIYPGQELYMYSLQNRNKNLFYFNIWKALYASNTMEQDSMVNGMYGYVMNRIEQDIENDTFKGTIDQYIMDSEAIQWLKNLYEAEEFLKENSESADFSIAFSDYNKNFGITAKKLFDLIKYGKKRFEEKIARVEWLCKSRQSKKYPLSEHIRAKDSKNFETTFQYTINLKNCIFE